MSDLAGRLMEQCLKLGAVKAESGRKKKGQRKSGGGERKSPVEEEGEEWLVAEEARAEELRSSLAAEAGEMEEAEGLEEALGALSAKATAGLRDLAARDAAAALAAHSAAEVEDAALWDAHRRSDDLKRLLDTAHRGLADIQKDAHAEVAAIRKVTLEGPHLDAKAPGDWANAAKTLDGCELDADLKEAVAKMKKIAMDFPTFAQGHPKPAKKTPKAAEEKGKAGELLTELCAALEWEAPSEEVLGAIRAQADATAADVLRQEGLDEPVDPWEPIIPEDARRILDERPSRLVPRKAHAIDAGQPKGPGDANVSWSQPLVKAQGGAVVEETAHQSQPPTSRSYGEDRSLGLLGTELRAFLLASQTPPPSEGGDSPSQALKEEMDLGLPKDGEAERSLDEELPLATAPPAPSTPKVSKAEEVPRTPPRTFATPTLAPKTAKAGRAKQLSQASQPASPLGAPLAVGWANVFGAKEGSGAEEQDSLECLGEHQRSWGSSQPSPSSSDGSPKPTPNCIIVNID